MEIILSRGRHHITDDHVVIGIGAEKNKKSYIRVNQETVASGRLYKSTMKQWLQVGYKKQT